MADPFRRALAALILAAALLWTPAAEHAQAQEAPVNLIADRVSFDRERELLTAEGNVEVLYEGRLLRASRLVYDRRAEEIHAEGPITLTDPAGEILLAEGAALDADLENGLVRGARLLIDEQLQLAAAEVRHAGRFTTLHRTVASSCTICPENPVPTWAIRAAKVTEDAETRRIYFEDATFEVFGLPFGWVPRMSIPDPRVGRASGFLTPVSLSSEIFGVGAKVPYYRVLGPSADATLTPFVTSGGTFILEGQYRRRMSTGGFDVGGVLAIDDGLGGGFGRGFFTTQGAFALGRGFLTDVDINVASDRTFLQEFDYSDADRLTSTAGIRRTRAKDNLEFGAIAFQSLREDEDTSTVPVVLPMLAYRRLAETPLAGGRLAFNVDALGLFRDEGIDMVRAGGGVDWARSWQFDAGVLAEATGAAPFDAYQVWDDPDEPDGALARVVPTISAELRWPFLRSAGGADEVIEPVAQVFWSEIVGAANTVPNEDSQLPRFDETNLFSSSRFPGRDRYETGLRANLGVTYDRIDPDGWEFGLTVGRVLHTDAIEDMPQGTGLAGRWSDIVTAASLRIGGLSLAGRALFDDDFVFRRNDFGVGIEGTRGAFASTWVYFAEDDSNPILGPQPETSELRVDGRYRLHRNWEVRGLWRYDLVADAPLRAGAALTYGNECTELDLSISRRYTSSDNLQPATSVGFSVALAGLGDREGRSWPQRGCQGSAG